MGGRFAKETIYLAEQFLVQVAKRNMNSPRDARMVSILQKSDGTCMLVIIPFEIKPRWITI